MSFLFKFLLVVVLAESALGISTEEPSTTKIPCGDMLQNCKKLEIDNVTDPGYCPRKLIYVKCVNGLVGKCENLVEFTIIVPPELENHPDCQKAKEIVSKYGPPTTAKPETSADSTEGSTEPIGVSKPTTPDCKETQVKNCKAKEDDNATTAEKYCQAKLAYVECAKQLADKCGNIVGVTIIVRPDFEKNENCLKAKEIVSNLQSTGTDLPTTKESNVTSTIVPTGNSTDVIIITTGNSSGHITETSTVNPGNVAKSNTGSMIAFALLAVFKVLELAVNP